MVILKSNNLPTYLAMIPKCLVMVGADTCPSCRKVKKELGSIATFVNVFLSPKSVKACKLGSGIISSSKDSANPLPNQVQSQT